MSMDCEIVVTEDDFIREVYRFYWIDRLGVVLDKYIPQTRATKRHKWKAERRDCWVRLDRRDNKIGRPEVPVEVQMKALKAIRDKIQYCEDPNA